MKECGLRQMNYFSVPSIFTTWPRMYVAVAE